MCWNAFKLLHKSNQIHKTKFFCCFFSPAPPPRFFFFSGMKQLTFASAKQHFNLTSGTKWIKKIHCLWIGKGGGGFLLCLIAINRQLIDCKLISALWKTQKATLANSRGEAKQTQSNQTLVRGGRYRWKVLNIRQKKSQMTQIISCFWSQRAKYSAKPRQNIHLINADTPPAACLLPLESGEGHDIHTHTCTH